jgi:hypothetical protein
MPHVYLIGTSHTQQVPRGSVGANTPFCEFVRGVLARYRVEGIGEEMNSELVEKRGLEKSPCQHLCDEVGLQHRFCEMTSEERSRKGLPPNTESYWINGHFAGKTESEILGEVRPILAAREEFWLSELSKWNVWPIVFVCGSLHVNTFAALLRSSGRKVSVIRKEWTPNYVFKPTPGVALGSYWACGRRGLTRR